MHGLVAHNVFVILEPREHGMSVLHEHRWLQPAERIQCCPAHTKIFVLELRNHGVGVLRERRRLQHAQRP
jgi:hypothetical protein